MGFSGQFALHKPTTADVRFGSKADIDALTSHVRFTPKSGHRGALPACPLSASRSSAVKAHGI